MGSVNESTEGFFNSWWGLVLLIIQIIAVLILVPSTQMESVYYGEQKQIIETFGAKAGNGIHERSSEWYDFLFEDSGVNFQTRRLFIPRSYDEGWEVSGAEEIGHNEVFPYIAERGRALSIFCQLVVQRISQISVWLPFVLMLFIPTLIDGYFVWKKKKYSYSYSSPWISKWAVKIVQIFLIIALIALLLPFTINAYIFPTLGMFLAPIVAMSISAHLPGEV